MGFELLSFVILIVTSGSNLNTSVVKDLSHLCIIVYDARHVAVSIHHPLSLTNKVGSRNTFLTNS